MSIRCEHCGAPYKGPISPYQRFFKCNYCGCITNIGRGETKGDVKRITVTETVVGPSRTFKITEFAVFLSKRGIKTFDPVSGVLKLGSQEVCINEEGAVEGPEPLKVRVEKWINDFMSS
jgi:hypothetical protein